MNDSYYKLIHWKESSLSELLQKLETGARPKGGVNHYKSGIPSIGGEHLKPNGTFDFQNLKFIPEDFANTLSRGKIDIGDVLIVKDGATTGKCVLVKNDFPYSNAYINEHIFLCRFWPELDSRFFAYFLQSELGQKRILDNFRGAAQGGIPQSFAKNTSIPVAPLNEQKRIADKLDTLFARVDSCREHLVRIPEILKRFRQAVLAESVSGKLTESWRKTRGLEDNWAFQKVSNITSKVGSGSTPHGGEKSYKSSGIPLIRSMNVIFYGFKRNGIAYLDKEQAEKLKNVEVKTKDVLLNITGASIGRVTLAPPDMEGARVNQHVCIIRPTQILLPEFLCAFLSAPKMQSFIGAENYGVTRQALTKEQILNFDIPIPTLEEQQEIVNRINSIFAFCSQIESRCQNVSDLVEDLTPAILSKAFRGELVPQDPNDEPAEQLLERIRDERRNHPQKPKRIQRREEVKIANKNTIISVVEALSKSGEELTSTQLFIAAGYPLDSEPDLVEEFFIDIRDSLKEEKIKRIRIENEDWFTINQH